MAFKKTFRKSNFASFSVPVKKHCNFCREKIEYIDFKNTKQLSKYLSRYMKIESRKRSGACAKHQRRLAIALKRSRHMALLPFVPKI